MDILQYDTDHPLVAVRVPSTSANLGPGFDTLGMAVDLYLDVQVFSYLGRSIAVFSGEGEGEVPLDQTNLMYRSMQRYAKAIEQPLPEYSLVVHNAIPLSRGLGSSAAAIVAGLHVCRALYNRKLNDREMLALAADIEGHADNVSAAFLGGITISCRHADQLVSECFPPPDSLCLVAVVPEVTVSTQEARGVLPDSVPMPDVVHAIQHVTLLTHALMSGKLDNLATAMEDRVHQPTRSTLVPGFTAVCAAGRQAGAFGVYLSGSGPTIMACCRKDTVAAISDAMVAAFSAAGVQSRALPLNPVVKQEDGGFRPVGQSTAIQNTA